MKFVTKAFVAGLMLTATAVFAAKSTDPDAKARQTLMDTIGMNTGILGNMAVGKAEFDAVKAGTAKAAIITASGLIAATFEPQGTDAESKAKPEIWTNWEDFLAKANGLTKAATALDATNMEGVQAGMAGLGGACKDCHTKYRL